MYKVLKHKVLLTLSDPMEYDVGFSCLIGLVHDVQSADLQSTVDTV